MDSYISLIPTNTIGKLYLGSISSLHDIEKLNITFVISLFPPVNVVIPQNIIRIEYSISDLPQYKEKMNSILDETSEIIHSQLSLGKNVLVHCFAGISRSSTVVLDYLLTHQLQILKEELKDELKDELTSYTSVLKYIQKFREVVNPNPGFATLLSEKHNLI